MQKCLFLHSEINNVMADLKKEFHYFIEYQEELVEKYNGKFLVIKDLEVKNAFDTMEEAYIWGNKEFEPGTFIIQECMSGKEVYSATFHSRVSLV